MFVLLLNYNIYHESLDKFEVLKLMYEFIYIVNIFCPAVEISKSGLEFVEVGYICNVHGLQGEIRVKPSTDFPELRFSEVI